MAAIKPVLSLTGAGEHTVVATWANVTENDTFVPIGPRYADYSDRNVQVAGTFGGATVVINGSNDDSNYFPLTDPQGNNISKNAAALEQITENALYVKPTHSAGAGESVTVILVMRRSRGGLEV